MEAMLYALACISYAHEVGQHEQGLGYAGAVLEELDYEHNPALLEELRQVYELCSQAF